MTHPLAPIFEPASVAIVGASSNPEKRGHQVVAALAASGFPGPVYPINPRGGEILGVQVFESLAALPQAPDLAYIARPAEAVPDAIADCGRRGIRGAIVPAVGFRESGEEGARLEADLLAAAREHGVRVIGPNTSGLLNTHARLHMVGGEPLEPGGLGILAQSGNIALDLMTSASARPIGISIYVGPGNETDIGFHEYVDYLGQHEPTQAIVTYIEGVHDGPALFETAREVARRKPIIALKGGRSIAGGRAALSHTGAITGSPEVFHALARQSGVIEVTRSDELLAVAETLASQPPLRRPAVAVLSDGGGHGTLSADHLIAAGVELSRLSSGTKEALANLLGSAASVANPVDVAGASDQAPDVLTKAFELLAADPEVGGVLMTGLFGGYAIRFADGLAAAELAAADGIAEATRKAGMPLVVHSLYAGRRPPPLDRLLERGIPTYESLERAVRCVSAVAERHAHLNGPIEISPEVSGRASAHEAVSGGWLSEHETRGLVGAHGVELVHAVLCTTADEAVAAAEGTDVLVLKAVSAHLPHKTEAGGVKLGLTADEVGAAFADMVEAVRRYLTEAGVSDDVEGVLVSPLLPEPVAELLLGCRRDPQYGPILTLAVGGTAVELHRDVSIRGLPSTARDVESMARELALAPLLFGYRGRPPVDLDAIVKMALALGDCLVGIPDLIEIELNPVFAYSDRAVAVDAIARLSG